MCVNDGSAAVDASVAAVGAQTRYCTRTHDCFLSLFTEMIQINYSVDYMKT